MLETKICRVCKAQLPLFNYYKQPMNKDGYDTRCKNCVSKRAKELYSKDKARKKNAKYYNKNKDVIKLRHYRNVMKRYHTDPVYKLRVNISRMLRASLVKGGYTKKSRTYHTLGCTFVEFKKYLEDNKYGFKVGDLDLDVDHIVPISSAKTEDEVLKLNHYSNFQLLPSEYNRSVKSDKPFDLNHFEDWLKDNTTFY